MLRRIQKMKISTFLSHKRTIPLKLLIHPLRSLLTSISIIIKSILSFLNIILKILPNILLLLIITLTQAIISNINKHISSIYPKNINLAIIFLNSDLLKLPQFLYKFFISVPKLNRRGRLYCYFSIVSGKLVFKRLL